jgi:plastocyanin
MITLLRRNVLRTTLALAAGVVSLACNSVPGPASPAATAPTAAPTSAPNAALPAGPRIVGTVLSTTGDPLKTGGVVYLEDAPKQPGVATTATVDVHNKDFSPLIAVVTTGGTVTFGNRDNLTHHVFSPDVQQWDTGYLQKGDTATRTFSAPGAIALLCNIHPEMIGYVLTIPSTYFGKVGADGKYVIANVPPGTYKTTLWVPRMPTTTQSVTVGASGSVTANFQLVNPPAK